MRYLKLFLILLIIPLLACKTTDSSSTENRGDLIAFYPFNGNANDVTGNSNESFIYEAVLTEDRFGNPNSAYLFDGFNDFINTNTSFDIPIRTTSVWFRSDSDNISTMSEENIIDQDSHTLENGVLRVGIEDGKIYMLEGAAPGWRTVFDELEKGVWFNITMVRGDSLATYYFNGQRFSESELGFIGSVSFANINMVIGANRSLTRKNFEGAIDDIRVYNYELSDSEILELYQEGGWPR